MPKPKTVVCYICGRDFGPHSINFHERQCAKRWEATNQKNRDQQNEKVDHKRKSRKDKSTVDPWRLDTLPPIRDSQDYSKSMEDIRMPSRAEPHATDSERQFMHTVRPQTVTLRSQRKREKGGSPSGEEVNGASDKDDESPKPARSGTVTLRKHLPASVLPSKVKAAEIINQKHRNKSASLVNATHLDECQGKPALHKHSVPEASIHVSRSSSSLSSASSQASSDSQDPMTSMISDHPNMSAPRFRSTKNPNMLVCYICGNEYGSKSLKIHEPQCLKKWKLANPRYYSRKGSSGGMFKAQSINSLHLSSTLNHKSFFQNETASVKGAKTSENSASMKSASCENLLDTAAYKTESGSLQALRELSKSHGRLSPSRKPKMVPCYICGREFIKHSLEVHEKQCMKKWDALKSKSDKALKGKKKLAPSENAPTKRHSINFPVTIKIDKDEDLENNNLELSKSQDCLDQETKIKKEEKAPGNSTVGAPRSRKPSAVTCYICGRAYGSASISIHEKQCQKKWEEQNAKKAEEEQRAKKERRIPRSRPKSFVL